MSRRIIAVAVLATTTAALVQCSAFGVGPADPGVDGSSSDTSLSSDGSTTNDADSIATSEDAGVGCCPGCTTVIANQQSPSAIVEAPIGQLFWNGPDGAIRTCTLPSCVPSLIAPAVFATSMTVFTASGTLMYTSTTGVFATSSTMTTAPVAVRASGAQIHQWDALAFWLDPPNSDIVSCAGATPTGGCSSGSFWQEPGIDLLAVNDGVFWTNIDGTIRGCNSPTNCGSAPINVTTDQPSPTAILADGTDVFWAVDREVRTAPRDGSGPVRTIITAVPVGSEPPDLASRPVAFANDANTLYWVNKDTGTVVQASKKDQPLAKILACNLKSPSDLVLSTYSLLVANTGAGTIVRVPLP